MSGINNKECIEEAVIITEKVGKIVKKIYKNVELANIDVVDRFATFNKPNAVINKLLKVYDLFISSDQTYKSIRKYYKTKYATEIHIPDVKTALEYEFIQNTKLLLETVDLLQEYDRINIIKSLMNGIAKFANEIITKLTYTYYDNLYVKCNNIKNMQELSTFLLKHSDTKEFLRKYADTLYKKCSYDKIKNDRILLLTEIEKLDATLCDINAYNRDVLGFNNGNGINVGLNKLLVISLRKNITAQLLIIENKEQLEDVPFLLRCNSLLKHNGQKTVKDIEDIFIFKNEINKILCNIFLTFVSNCSKLEIPNGFCDIETLSLHLKRALDSMHEYATTARVFVKNYGPFFKTKSLDEFTETLSLRLTKQIMKISEQLPTIRKNIYLINNLYALQTFVTQINLAENIRECADDIVAVFAKELSTKNDSKFTKFINDNLDSFKTYHLPLEVKDQIVTKIKKTVWESMVAKKYTDNSDTLNKRIDDIFSGQ